MKRYRFGEEREADTSINLANLLVLLSRGSENMTTMDPGRVFECKTCSRQFTSFQALGGHRASHKKPRSSDDRSNPSVTAKAKVHECSLCGTEFATGQALGGHMRRHRVAVEGFSCHGSHVDNKYSNNGKKVLLDLNLPPLEEDKETRSKLGWGQGLGLANRTPILLDCFH